MCLFQNDSVVPPVLKKKKVIICFGPIEQSDNSEEVQVFFVCC